MYEGGVPLMVGKVHEELQLNDQLTVTLTAEEEFPDFIIRTITVQCESQSRVIRQFHYISWPDHGVPESTAVTVTILRRAKAARTPGGGPMVVHCSAGVGRTGTLLAIDYNMDRSAKTGTIDVFGTLNEMRRQRSTMVQTEEQYIFIYRTLADACSQTATEMSPEALRKHYTELHNSVSEGGTVLEAEFKRVSDFAPPALRTDSAQLAANKPKNRFQNILPYENTRVKLQAIPGVVGSDYINASWIDGFKQKSAFIATQGPMEHTVSDFWRMIWERECHGIVMLTALSESGRVKSEQYWPDPDEPPLSAGDYQIVLRGEVNLGWCVERTLQIVDLVSETAREVRHWQYLAWPASGIPQTGRSLVELIQRVETYERSLVVVAEESIYGNAKAIAEQAILKQMRPVVVHCSAGVGRTGVYCALAICIKRIQEEQKMDLATVTKHLRTQRPAMIQTAEQYEFVYRCIIDYLDLSVGELVYIYMQRLGYFDIFYIKKIL